MRSKSIAVDDVEVDLDVWTTRELIAELRDRAAGGDEDARRCLGLEVAQDDGEPLSAAAVLSKQEARPRRADLEKVAAATGVGARSVTNAHLEDA